LKRTLAKANKNHRNAVNEIGKQLKNLHSETATEPLPEEMRRLLQKLDRRRSSRRP
jgi:aminoglycoside phosphotransferase